MNDNYLEKELYSLIKTDTSIFDFLQNGSLDGIWYWDLDNPENEWMSEHFWTTLGYDPSEMSHHSSEWHDKINKDDLQTAVENFYKHLDNSDHPYDQIVRYKHKNASTVWIRCRGIAIMDSEGKATRMLGAHNDITNLMEAQEELKKLNDTLSDKIEIEISENRKKDAILLAQSRQAQMGEMISMIAHQWRQPLAVISMIANTVILDIELGDTNEDSMEKSAKDILENINHLSNTINDFRNFYKMSKKSVTLKPENIVLKSLSIVKTSLLNNNIEIIEEYNSKEEIELFDSELMQVILNILKNAQDNFKEKNIKDPYIKITTENRTISICDNGGGMPEDLIEKIFDPYFSTKDEKNGTGLGLYMSKTIIENHHNGKLTAKNTDDGVCFTIELGIILEK